MDNQPRRLTDAVDVIIEELRELQPYDPPHLPHIGTECGICLARQLGVTRTQNSQELAT